MTSAREDQFGVSQVLCLCIATQLLLFISTFGSLHSNLPVGACASLVLHALCFCFAVILIHFPSCSILGPSWKRITSSCPTSGSRG